MKLITLLTITILLFFKSSETLSPKDLRWAATIYAEGRGCDLDSMLKDASVMMNRVTDDCDIYCVISKSKVSSKTGKIIKQFSGYENSNYKHFMTAFYMNALDSKMVHAIKAVNTIKEKGSILPKNVLYYRNITIAKPHKWWDTLTIKDTSNCGHTYYSK